MDKKTLTGVALMVLVVLGFNWWSRPSESQLREMARQDSIAAAKEVQAQQSEQARLIAEQKKTDEMRRDSSRLFFANLSGEAKTVTLKNKLVNLQFSTQGATVQSATILGYKDQEKQDVRLLTQGENQLDLTLESKSENIHFRDLYFQTAQQTDSTVTFLATAANGGTLAVKYKLRPNTYVLDMIIEAQGLENYFSPTTRSMAIQWSQLARQQEKGFSFENRYSTLTYKDNKGETDNLSETNDDEETSIENLEWVAFKNQFFSAILIAHQNLDKPELKSTQMQEGSGYLKKFEMQAQTLFDPSGKQPTQMQMYLGPNDFHVLQSVNEESLSKEDLDVHTLVYFGWPLVRLINRFFIVYLFDWLRTLGLPMGIVLLLLTLIIKAIVYPATRKSYLSSARMRVLKPEIDKLSAKYPKPEDAMKKQQEMMQLYNQYGASPMGGCLPMLIQFPVWIALFNFVPNAIELRGQSFLWAEDLSAYDSLIHWDTTLPLIGNHISIFCLLFSLTNVVNTVISMRQQQQSAMMSPEQEVQMKMMKWMMYIMPVAFFFMFNDYSSGLCYYYFLSGLTSILITWFLRQTTDDEKLLAKMRAYKEKNANNPKKQGALAQRLEAMQQMVEKQQRLQQQNKK